MSAKYTEFCEYKKFCSQSSYRGEKQPKCEKENHKKVNFWKSSQSFQYYDINFESQMKPTNLYLMIIIEIYIFDHLVPQMQSYLTFRKPWVISPKLPRDRQKSSNLITNDYFEIERL